MKLLVPPSSIAAGKQGLRMGLRVRALIFIPGFLALAFGVTVAAMSWNARTTVIEQVERDAEVLAQSLTISQHLPDQVKEGLGQGMQATVATVPQLVVTADIAGQSPAQIKASLKQSIASSMIAEVWVTDSKGRACLNSPLQGVDFTFNPDPQVQAQVSTSWPLLAGKASVLNQPMSRREIDNLPFRYAGVPDVDKPGIVQVGTPGESLQALKAIYVVQQDMAELAAEVASRSGKPNLSATQRETLRDVIATGKGRTVILPDHIEVFQTLRDEYDSRVGAFTVQLLRRGLDSLSFADRIAKPIDTVTQVAGQVNRGDFAQLEKLERAGARQDEIGELARVFQTTATEVHHRERVLDEWVAQRIQALGDKYLALSDAQALIEHIFSDVARFADGAPQSDDITVAALTWKGETT